MMNQVINIFYQEVLYKEGDIADDIFLILNGVVEIS